VNRTRITIADVVIMVLGTITFFCQTGQRGARLVGLVYINTENNHTWKIARIGKVREDGLFDIVWSSENPIRPEPYPVFRSENEWDVFLQDLYEGWNNNWANLEYSK